MNQVENNKTWIIRTIDFKSSSVEAKIIECDKSEAMSRGLVQLFKFWGIGLLCILIPMLHFLLVPAFFIIGIYSFLKSLKYKFRIENPGFAVCPNCQKRIELKSFWFEFQYRFSCQYCSEQLVLELKGI